jgi:ABC-type nitrate/sulfonate/bicarbonate transport system ATPase subunit
MQINFVGRIEYNIMSLYFDGRCNIPVIVMGETGCGKTRLVRFMCALQNPETKRSTMIIMKVLLPSRKLYFGKVKNNMLVA